MKIFTATILLASLLSAGLILLNGCKKSEPPTSSKSKTEEVNSAAVEQIICPVMGNPINRQFFTEYKGKKIYFCCPECVGKFNVEPEKYIAKLPQFK